MQINIKNVFFVWVTILALTSCGKATDPQATQSNELEELDHDFALAWENDGALLVRGISPEVQQRLQQFQKRIQALRNGIQACKADLNRLNPTLAQQKPTTREELKAKAQSVIAFFQQSRASLSAECIAFVDKLQALRQKLQQH